MQEAFSSVFNGGNFTIFDTRNSGGAGVLEGLTPGQRVQSNKGGKNAGTGGQSFLRSQALSSLQNLVKAGKVKVIPTENGFAISLVTDLSFGSASAALKADAMPVLQQVADFVGQIPNSLVIEGHTDNIPAEPGAVARGQLAACGGAFRRRAADPRRLRGSHRTAVRLLVREHPAGAVQRHRGRQGLQPARGHRDRGEAVGILPGTGCGYS